MEHSRYVVGKISGAAYRMKAVAGRTWGTDPRTLKQIYDGAIKPALLYASEIWEHRYTISRIKKSLQAAQRPFLLDVTRAYRTTSIATLEVLAGSKPLRQVDRE